MKKKQSERVPSALSPAEIVDRLFTGHAAEVLSTFSADSVDLVVTSPPYWNAVEYDQGENPGRPMMPTSPTCNWYGANVPGCLGPTASYASTLQSCRF